MSKGISLRVAEARYDEVFTDTVRIAEKNRIDLDKSTIANGTVIRIDHNGKKAYAIVRGQAEGERPGDTIIMDEFIRTRLGVKQDETISSCGIRSATPFEKIIWYFYATNPAVHVPAWLAVISVGLGVLSLVLTIAFAFL